MFYKKIVFLQLFLSLVSFSQINIFLNKIGKRNIDRGDFFNCSFLLTRGAFAENLSSFEKIDSLVWYDSISFSKLTCNYNQNNVLDSCTLMPFQYTYVFRYNYFGKLKNVNEYQSFEDSNEPTFKEDIFYYGEQRTKTRIHYLYNNEWNEWQPVLKSDYTYPKSGEEILTRHWNGHYWENRNIVENYYKESELIFSIQSKYVSDHWEKDVMFENVYSGGKLSETKIYLWINNSWENLWKEKYKYINEKLYKELFIIKDNNQWRNYGRYLYEYNGDGLLDKIIFEWWNAEREKWEADGPPVTFVVKLSDEVTFYMLGNKVEIFYHGDESKVLLANENKFLSIFELNQNYPNPFNPTTTISYSIPTVVSRSEAQSQSVNVTLNVYNALGEKVTTLVNKAQTPGNYTVQFNASNLPSGVYFYTLRAGEFVATKKMILMK
jgi:hypothetical protein